MANVQDLVEVLPTTSTLVSSPILCDTYGVDIPRERESVQPTKVVQESSRVTVSDVSSSTITQLVLFRTCFPTTTDLVGDGYASTQKGRPHMASISED